MTETLKRAISGLFYIAIMWFATSYSEFSYKLLFAVLALISLYEMWILRKSKSKIFAISYIIIPFFLIQDINYLEKEFNPSIILFMFLLTWTFDSFAYIFGINFGKNKIIPNISPNKSWEGFIGGYLFTIIVSYLSYSYFEFTSIKHILIISIILPFTATLGDFIISFYKRKAGVKDSGKLIPGHGGVLDRMDAFIITIPSIYIIINLL